MANVKTEPSLSIQEVEDKIAQVQAQTLDSLPLEAKGLEAMKALITQVVDSKLDHAKHDQN